MQYVDDEGKKQWRCHWCGRNFQHWNATKALFHVTKTPGGDVRRCTSKAIDAVHQQEYQNLLQKQNQRKVQLKHVTESKKRTSDEYINNAGAAYNASKRQKTPPSAYSTPSATAGPVQAQLNFESATPTTRQAHTSQRFHQQTIDNTLDQHSDAKLTMAIADLIHSCGLPFSLASHHKFQRVLQLAKNVSKKYIPPGRNKVAGELLDMNYQLYKKQMSEKLLKEADVYGIAFFGDGATVRKTPLINILASSVHQPVACLRIVDCSSHLERDGIKDATYISELFLPHITEMEESVPKCTDLVIFDGASNVQKAGALLEAKFPHLSVIHGAEHVISLFYSDVFRLPQFELLKKLNRLIYSYFGSGSMHSPYAIFSKHSRDHNGGRCIGLIRAADTRMAGHVISMLRTLRLKDSLLSTISSASFIQGKFKVS